MTRPDAGSDVTANAAMQISKDAAAGPPAGAALPLPPPNTQGGKPLMEALSARRSMREYSSRPLLSHVLSDLLWAALGINRPDSDGRTAPCWRHFLVIDVYVATPHGVWLYEPTGHRLLPYQSADLRAETGTQEFVATAPLNLIYVAHGERMGDVPAQDRRLYACVDAAFIGQNVYLFCASEGLGTVFRGALDCDRLGRMLALGSGQFVTFAQTVGYPQV